MLPAMSGQTPFALTVFAQTIILAAAAVISYIAWSTGRKRERAEFSRNMNDQWNKVNVLAAKEPELGDAIDRILGVEDPTEDIVAKRRRWMAFVILNSLQSYFFGVSDRLIKRDYANVVFEQLLLPILQQDDLFLLTQTRGYHPKFARFCAKLRERGVAGHSGTSAAKTEQQRPSDLNLER
jgi:hypothetical protein